MKGIMLGLEGFGTLDVGKARNVSELFFLGGVLLVLSICLLTGRKEFRTERVKVIWLGALVAALGSGLCLVLDEMRPTGYDRFLPALQLFKDAPGMFLLPYLATLATDHLPNLKDRRQRWLPALLRSGYKVFLVFFVLATIAAASTTAGANLDRSAELWALAYRGFIATPVGVYTALLAFFYAEAFLTEPATPTVRKRYLLYAGGCSTFALLAVHWFSWPILPGAWAGTTTVMLPAQAALWLFLAACWTSALTLPLARGRTQRTFDGFERYDNDVDDLTYELQSHRVAPLPEAPQLRTADYLIEYAAARLAPAGMDAQDASAASITVALAARLAHPSGNREALLRRICSLAEGYEELLCVLPNDAPHKDLWERNPVRKAIKAVLLLADEPSAYRVPDEPFWLQLAALVAADQGLLGSSASRWILSEDCRSVAPAVWSAFLLSKLSLEEKWPD